MTPAEAAPLIRRWLEDHGRWVAFTLARFGVRDAADRADLEQEVFTTAFLALLRGESIDSPRAWLNECARKKASNHRQKEQRRTRLGSGEGFGTMTSPAQIAEDREALSFVFECLDSESQEIVLAVRADGLSWDEIARERGIKPERARYLYALAVTQMDGALKREDARLNKHRAVAFPILLAQVFDAIRAEVDATPPELDRRVREGLDRFMDAAGAGATSPDSERVSVARPTPTSPPVTTLPAAPTTVGPVLGILGSGVVIGIVLGYLVHGSSPDRVAPEPSRPRSTPVLAIAEPVVEPHGAQAAGSRFAVAIETAASPPQGIRGAQRASAADRASAAPAIGSQLLIDHARTALGSGNAQAALALLTEHAHRFPTVSGAGDRRELVLRVCAAPEGRESVECASLSAGVAPE